MGTWVFRRRIEARQHALADSEKLGLALDQPRVTIRVLQAERLVEPARKDLLDGGADDPELPFDFESIHFGPLRPVRHNGDALSNSS